MEVSLWNLGGLVSLESDGRGRFWHVVGVGGGTRFQGLLMIFFKDLFI